MNDPLKRMRRGNPVPSADAPELEPILERIAAGDGPSPPRRRGLRRLGRPAALALVFVPLGAAAAAVAASGLLTGEPVKPRPGTTFSPSVGLGLPVKGSVRLLDLRVPDPAGGPPWGMRVLSTTRKQGCIQVGRVVGGRLGVLGRDRAFADDGRFHELPPRLTDHSHCTLLDGAGRTYLAVNMRGLAASGLGTACRVRATRIRLPARMPRREQPPPVCDPKSVRVLMFGLLGPHATSVTYRGAGGATVKQPVASPRGAYLIVLPPDGMGRLDGQWTQLPGPGSGLQSVRYRDGHICRIPPPSAFGGAKPCPPVGYAEPRRPTITSAQVAAPVSVKLTPGTGSARGQDRLDATFTARVAVRDGRSGYALSVVMPRGKGCTTSGTSAPSIGNIAAGRRVRISSYVPGDCAGIAEGSVAYTRQIGTEPPPALTMRTRPSDGVAIVGRFRVRNPR